MAKATVHSGPSFSDVELSDPLPPDVMIKNLPENPDRPVPRITRAMVGGDPESVGSSSDQSSVDESNSSNIPSQSRREAAPSAENLSNLSEKESADDASLTDGNTQETETESDELPPYDEWTVTELQDECRARNLIVSHRNKAELVTRLEEYDAQNPDE